MRKVFLEILPKKYGFGANKDRLVIDWKSSIGMLVEFVYKDIIGKVEIVDYDGKYLYIKYKDKEPFKINTDGFKDCKFGKLLSDNIATIAPWMVKFFVNPEEAKKYTIGSRQKIKVKCPDCGNEKEIVINKLYARKSISCNRCGDGRYYPEKLAHSFLEQLNVKFNSQQMFKWTRNIKHNNPKLSGDKKYDFYIPSMNVIIETHGEQHYETSFESCGGRSLEEEVENDRLKKELALLNGIKEENYIVVDCRKSELEWIKGNILNSKLNVLFDLSNIDWNKAEEYSLKNLVKLACEYKRDNPDITTKEIGEIMKLNRGTITKYLIKGSKIWDWCNYNGKEEMIKAVSKNGKSNGKQVEVFKDGVSLGIFESAIELDRQSEDLFGIKLNYSSISAVCRENKSQYKDFIFRYIDKQKNNNIA